MLKLLVRCYSNLSLQKCYATTIRICRDKFLFECHFLLRAIPFEILRGGGSKLWIFDLDLPKRHIPKIMPIGGRKLS